MSRTDAVRAAFRGGLVELVRPGEGQLSGRAMLRFGQILLPIVIVLTNVIGAVAVLALALWVVPMPLRHLNVGHVELLNSLVAAGYVAIAVPLGVTLGTRGMLRLRTWLREERPATLSEIRLLLSAPLRLFGLQVALWFFAALVFGVLDAT